MIHLGRWEIESIVCGRFRLDGGAMFGVVPKTLWERGADVDDQNRVLLANRALIAWHKASGRILIADTGTGTKWNSVDAERYAIESTPNAIDDALEKRGASADDVTDVIVTHLHFDHCGGMTVWADEPGGPTRLRFPKARHWVHRRHWEHAHRPTLRDRASFLAIDFDVLGQSNTLEFVDGDQPNSSIDDIEWMISNGHTPAQLLPRFLGGEDANLLFVGDMVPTAPHLPLPWVMAYDLHPLTTLAEREATYEQCRREGLRLAFPHDPEHGVVAVEFDGRKVHIEESFA